MSRIDWPAIIDRAADIVRSYDTSVTLRQLFYRLVSEQLVPNSTAAYKRLSSLTAEARRWGRFPPLLDRGRQIHRDPFWDNAADAVEALLDQFRLDRTAGQDVSLYLGVEKAGMVVQLRSWFGDLGVPVLALGGYSSHTYAAIVRHHVRAQERRAVLLYAGDFDPSGEDIDRDFIEQTNCWVKVVRVALTAEQVQEHGLPINPGKVTDSRAAGFIERHGELMQVELDALDPDTLQAMFEAALDEFWDASAYETVLDLEQAEHERLAEVAREVGDSR
jgi:hypothetical protein